jgi:hypothetical protein
MNDKILVFGDEVVDWIDIPRKPDSTGTSKNWRLTPGTIRVATGGGAYLITDVLRELYDNITVSGPEFNKTLIPGKEKCIQSYARLEEYIEEKNDKKNHFGGLRNLWVTMVLRIQPNQIFHLKNNHNCIIDWDEEKPLKDGSKKVLSVKDKNKDKDAIQNFAKVLEAAGFVIVREKS